MNAFDRYVFRQLLVGVILVTAGLTGVLWLSQSLRFVDFIVNRGLDIVTFFHLVMLLLPNFMLVILPIAVFAAVCFTYAKLISDREMIVMGASGVSPFGLAKPALLLAVLVSLITYTLNMTVLPASYRMFRELQWDLRYNYAHVLLEEGAFTDAGEGITVYVRERSPDGQLRGILVHDARNDEDPSTLMAERGALVAVDGGSRVVLFNGSRQTIDPDNHSLSMLYFERYMFDLEQTRRSSLDRYREPEERTLWELFEIREDPSIEPRDYGQFLVEGHRRLSAPLSAIGYALIGAAILLQGSYQRGRQARNVVLAVAAAVGIALTALGVEGLAGRNLSLVPLLYVCNILPIFVGALLLAKPWRRRSPDGDGVVAAGA